MATTRAIPISAFQGWNAGVKADAPCAGRLPDGTCCPLPAWRDGLCSAHARSATARVPITRELERLADAGRWLLQGGQQDDPVAQGLLLGLLLAESGHGADLLASWRRGMADPDVPAFQRRWGAVAQRCWARVAASWLATTEVRR
jgi:hypothetical protein